jgi:hypothetical protein
MTIGGSILLIAIGAILRFAIDVTVRGVDLQVIGLILMIAGAVGLVLALFYTYVLAERGGGYAEDPRRRPPPP